MFGSQVDLLMHHNLKLIKQKKMVFQLNKEIKNNFNHYKIVVVKIAEIN